MKQFQQIILFPFVFSLKTNLDCVDGLTNPVTGLFFPVTGLNPCDVPKRAVGNGFDKEVPGLEQIKKQNNKNVGMYKKRGCTIWVNYRGAVAILSSAIIASASVSSSISVSSI